ncbi:MAG: NAD+ synthase [Ideonella sp.]|nr:NAD+ synthase [Ideonella sp.]
MPLPFVLTIAQLNPTVGDLAGNVERIAQGARQAHAAGSRLVVTPELSLTGYPPEDLLLRDAFLEATEVALGDLARRLADLPGLRVVVGHPHRPPGRGDWRTRSVAVPRRFNAASVLGDGRILATYCKRELPNYQVFDERRYFASGREAGLGPVVFECAGVRFGLLICEDAWFPEPARLAREAGAECLCVLNASPFHLGKGAEREARMAECARGAGLPLLYAHLTGGQDEVVFDGASFAVDAKGRVTARAPMFEEALLSLEWRDGAAHGPVAEPPALEAQAWQALVTGVRDYLGKNGFPGAIIGLSGGIDSALVLAVAVDALGPERVRAVMMPSRYTAEISRVDARDMAERLGVRYDEIAIEPMFEAFRSSLAPQFAGRAEDTTEENLQARVRGTLLMALSNKFGSVIKDVAKMLVYRLAAWRNAQPRPRADGTMGPVIPERIITRAPSAELRANQTDQDSLPPYEVLDAILQRYMEDDESIDEIVAAGFDRAVVERVAHLIRISEYKRRQAPVGIRITHRAFGRDWRYPITSRFRA